MFSANGDLFLSPRKSSKQPKQRRQIRRGWINNYIQRSQRYQTFTAPRSLFVTSKRWIIGPLKTRWDLPMVRCAEFSDALSLRCGNNFAPLSPQQIESMATVHDEIDNWLAADLYGELSNQEQQELHTHLVECASCRKTHQETKTMNKILEETLALQKPDPAFEQRMLTGFRDRIPEKSGLLKSLSDLMHARAAQVTAVTAVLLGLVQLGRIITGE